MPDRPFHNIISTSIDASRTRFDAAGEEPPGAGVDDDGEDAVGELDLEAAEEGDEADDGQLFDYSALCLKEDHGNRPLWVCPNGSVFLETYSPIYKQAYDFLITVAEPNCAKFIKDSTENFGKVKLVLDQSRFYVESPHHDILDSLMADDVIKAAVIHDTSSGLRTRRTLLDDAVRGGEGEEPLDEEMEAAFGHDAPKAFPSSALGCKPPQARLMLVQDSLPLGAQRRRLCLPVHPAPCILA
eukprot:jgi/Tetstr1/431661/TSEL_021190.t1